MIDHKYIAAAEPLYDLIMPDLQLMGLRQACFSACEFFDPIFDPDERQLVLETFPRFLVPILPIALDLLSINLVDGRPDICLAANQAVALLECFNYLCSDQGFAILDELSIPSDPLPITLHDVMRSKINVFYIPPRWVAAVRSAVESDTVYQFSLIIEHLKSPRSTIDSLIALLNGDNSLFAFDFEKAAMGNIPVLGGLLPLIETHERMVIQAIQKKFGKNTEDYWNAMMATVRRLVLDDYDTTVMPTDKIYSWIRNSAIIPVSMSNRSPKLGLRFTHSEFKPIMELAGSITNLSVELIAWGGVIPPIPHFDTLLNSRRIHKLSVARATSVDQSWLTRIMAIGLPKIDLGRQNLVWARFYELSPQFRTIELDLSGASNIPREWLDIVFSSALLKLNLSTTSLNRYTIPDGVNGPRSLRWVNLSNAAGIDRRFAVQLINSGVMWIDLSSQNFETDNLGPSHLSVQLASDLPQGQRINLERCYNSKWLSDQLNQRRVTVS